MGVGWSDPARKRTTAEDGLTLAPDEPGLLLKGIVYALLLELAVLIGVAGITFLVFVIATRRL